MTTETRQAETRPDPFDPDSQANDYAPAWLPIAPQLDRKTGEVRAPKSPPVLIGTASGTDVRQAEFGGRERTYLILTLSDIEVDRIVDYMQRSDKIAATRQGWDEKDIRDYFAGEGREAMAIHVLHGGLITPLDRLRPQEGERVLIAFEGWRWSEKADHAEAGFFPAKPNHVTDNTLGFYSYEVRVDRAAGGSGVKASDYDIATGKTPEPTMPANEMAPQQTYVPQDPGPEAGWSHPANGGNAEDDIPF